METIKRKTGDRFREMIWINGKSIKSPIFKRKTDARDWKAKMQSMKVDQGIMGGSVNLFKKSILKDYSLEWLKSKAPTLQRSSREEYKRYLELHILPTTYKGVPIGDKDLKDLDAQTVRHLQSELLSKLSPKSTNCVMRVFKSILDCAVDDGYVTRSPAKKIPSVKEDPAAERFWSISEINLFSMETSRSDPALHDFGMFALNTGMRRGEVAALEFTDVDFNLRIAHVFKTKDKFETKNRTKTALRRAVPLNDVAIFILRKRIQLKLPGQKHIFTEEDGSDFGLHHLYRRWAKMHTRAGISNITVFQDTRDTFATQFMLNGGELDKLQKILGHTKIEMTLKYVKYSPKYLKDAVSNFNLGSVENEFSHILTTATKDQAEISYIQKSNMN